MPDRHALLGPSGASRWLVCTRAPRLEETLPEKPSIFAERGHLAHELAELKLNRWLHPEAMTTRTANARIKKMKARQFQDEILWETAMDPNTDAYLDFIKETANAMPERPYIAVEQEVDLSEYIPESFGTADCILIGSRILHVVDYKNGAGVPVSATENTQMKLYALGAFLKYGMLFEIATIRMSIMQPNVSPEPQTYETTTPALLEWADGITPAANRAFNGNGDFVPGDHCRFCRAAATCRARAEHMLKAEGFAPMLPPLISLDEASDILQRTRELANYITKLEAYILEQCLSGQEVPGWKAVEGRSIRRFSDLDAAFAKARAYGVADELLFERKPITLSQLEKAMGKPIFEDQLKEFITKPPGAPTLVPETDKRQPIAKATAADDFKPATEDLTNE